MSDSDEPVIKKDSDEEAAKLKCCMIVTTLLGWMLYFLVSSAILLNRHASPVENCVVVRDAAVNTVVNGKGHFMGFDITVELKWPCHDRKANQRTNESAWQEDSALRPISTSGSWCYGSSYLNGYDRPIDIDDDDIDVEALQVKSSPSWDGNLSEDQVRSLADQFKTDKIIPVCFPAEDASPFNDDGSIRQNQVLINRSDLSLKVTHYAVIVAIVGLLAIRFYVYYFGPYISQASNYYKEHGCFLAKIRKDSTGETLPEP